MNQTGETAEGPSGRLASSFRDPCGFVFTRGGRLFRQVNRVGRVGYDGLMATGLYDELTAAGLLVPHAEVGEPPAVAETAYKVLEPRRVPFLTYPYEWCFGQLRDAALLTLEVQRRALARGMSLKDASAYNVQFAGGRPVFIDTLSFETVRERPWVAYRQFTQHFLAPMALVATCHEALGRLSRIHLDGVPLDLASRLLPARTYLNPHLLLHVHLHARAASRYAARPDPARVRPLSVGAQRTLVEGLEAAVRGLAWRPRKTEWVGYYEDDAYAPAASAQKRAAVARFLDDRKPATVWDVGANTGEYSRLATGRGALAVAIDVDPACVERNYRDAVARGDGLMLPVVMDALNPSPALGWLCRERPSLLDRGPADACFALAAVHHLAVTGNVPLDQVAEFLRRAGRSLVVEFVPKTDPQFRRIMGVRDDVFADYSQAGFEAAFARYFTTDRAERLADSERTLYQMTGRPGV